MTLPAGRSVSICTKSTGHLEEAVLQVLVAARVFLGQRVNLQEKYDYPGKQGEHAERLSFVATDCAMVTEGLAEASQVLPACA